MPDHPDNQVACDTCRGTGKQEGAACGRCDGSGRCHNCRGTGVRRASLGGEGSNVYHVAGAADASTAKARVPCRLPAERVAARARSRAVEGRRQGPGARPSPSGPTPQRAGHPRRPSRRGLGARRWRTSARRWTPTGKR
jgi:hypothetical protein